MSTSHRRPRRLTQLRVDEVSVVTKPANNKRFLILKSASAGTPATPDQVAKIIRDTVTAAVTPLMRRLEAVEIAAQIRKGKVQRPGSVRKADGTFSWEGTHFLN